MNANELRIGNYVNINSPITEENKNICVSTYHIAKLQKMKGAYNSIPLTEEWLDKYEFKKFESEGIVGFDFSDFSEKTIVFEKGRFTIVKWGINNPFFYSNNNLRVELKYVHQLQNLYFALTGQELTIK